MTYPPDFPPRIVRPRKPNPETRPVIAATRDLVVVESWGDEVFSAEELPQILRKHPPAILVVQGFGSHLQRLQRTYEHDKDFNYRLTPIKRYSRPWNDGRKLTQGMIVDAICNFVGWVERRDDKGRVKETRYHYPLDPIWFLTADIEQLDPSDDARIAKLFRWGKQVRDWCAANGLQVKASAGGIAAQLLKDPRFFPEPRRKAPKLINNIARPTLPGNYYRLHAETGRYYRAIHLDMENAHHAIASGLSFPDVNTLHAYGNWSADFRDNPPSQAFAPGNSDVLLRPGLFHVRISVPHIPHHHFPPPYMETQGERDAFLYSTELELVRHHGGEITKVYAAYCSKGTDRGLNRYARFAIEEIRNNRESKKWLKPTLHSTYGLLAARPLPFETGYLRAQGGVSGEYHMGNVSLPVLVKKRPVEIEARICNVIHRGMIEAAVRKQVLWFARYLTEVERHNVLAIYADALFIENTGRPLGLLHPPWRLSGYVDSLRFHSAVHFTSPTISRLPGVPQDAREAFLHTRELSRDHAERLVARSKLAPGELDARRERNRVARNMRDGKPRSVRPPR